MSKRLIRGTLILLLGAAAVYGTSIALRKTVRVQVEQGIQKSLTEASDRELRLLSEVLSATLFQHAVAVRNYLDILGDDRSTTNIEAWMKRQSAILGWTHFQRVGNYEKHTWKETFSLVNLEAPQALLQSDLDDLEEKSPFDLDFAHDGKVAVQLGVTKNKTPVLRMTIPIPRPQYQSSSELVGITLNAKILEPFFEEGAVLPTYLVDRRGILLYQTGMGDWTPGDNLNYLPIVKEAIGSREPAGKLNFAPLPQSVPISGRFLKVKSTGLILISHFGSPES